MPRKDFLDGLKKQQVLYTKRQYLVHFMICKKAREIFAAKWRDKIACEAKLFPYWHSICHLIGDYSQREPHPRLTPALQAQYEAERREMARERFEKAPSGTLGSC
jgi:hypothetical protein